MNSSGLKPIGSVIAGIIAVLGFIAAVIGCAAPRHAAVNQTLEFDPASNEWQAVEPAPKGTPQGDLERARAALANGDHSAAHRRIKRWLKTYDGTSPYDFEARLLRARIEIAGRHFDTAHKVLAELLQLGPPLSVRDEALEYEFVIAEEFLRGAKRRVWGIFWVSAEELGLEILDNIAFDNPDTSLAELAIKTRADYFFFVEQDYALAELDYSRLVESFPRSRYRRYADIKIADSALASFAGIEYDIAPLIEAEDRYADYLQDYPEAPERERITTLLRDIYQTRGAAELQVARYYERAGRPAAAAFYYGSTVDHWPESVASDKARQRLEILQVPPGRTAHEETPPAGRPADADVIEERAQKDLE